MIEETFECLSRERCERYLERLEMPWPEVLDRAYLDSLIEAHLMHIPFENFTSCVYREPVLIDLDSTYEKIVVNKRGGYCFEMNSLFLGLLRGLGYNAYPIGVRLLRPGMTVAGAVSHRGSVVVLDGVKHYCDVGLGSVACSRAVTMVDGAETETFLGTFKYEDLCEGWMMQLYKGHNEDEWRQVMISGTVPAIPIDFQGPNQNMQHPPAPFSIMLMTQILTPTGTCSINNDILTIRGPEGKTQTKLETAEDLQKAMSEIFHVDFDLDVCKQWVPKE